MKNIQKFSGIIILLFPFFSSCANSALNPGPYVPSVNTEGLLLSPIDNEGLSAPTSFTNGIFPRQWNWNSAITQPIVAAATSGTPCIRHIRNGRVIATYSQLAGGRSEPNNMDGHDASVGPFRRGLFQQWMDGDIFELEPAVYEGENQQIFIGPNYPNDAAWPHSPVVPKRLTIRGITVDGKRPVIRNPSSGASNNTYGQALIYIGQCEGVTIENLDVVDSASGGNLGMSGIYMNGAKDLTLRNVRIANFSLHDANGLFGTPNNSGTIRIQNCVLSGNGGGNGPEHNVYINPSNSDPNFTVTLMGSWTQGSYYGHLFKSRAQRNIIEGNYFQGSRAPDGGMTDTYLLDIPEGGTLIVRNNIFVKDWSGNNSNGASITFAVERGGDVPFDQDRPWELLVEHNTFVAFDRYYDTQNHPLYPFFFNRDAPCTPTVRNNVFVGYYSNFDPGTNSLILNFNDIDQSYRVRNPVLTGNPAIRGTIGYAHTALGKARTTTAIGARD